MRERIYWNSHKKCWSVMGKGGVMHKSSVYLKDVSLVVRPAGRARAIRERKKNVHAFAVGSPCRKRQVNLERVSYNPYRAPTFTKANAKPVVSAGYAELRKDGTLFVNGARNVR